MNSTVAETMFIIAMLLSSTFMLSLAAWIRSYAENFAAKLIVYWAAIYPVLGILAIAHVVAPDLQFARTLYAVSNAISSLVPLLVFLFTLAYTGRARWLSRRVLGVFAAWYLLLAGLAVTDPVLGLAYGEFVVVDGPITYVYGMPTGLYSVLSLPVWLFMVAPPALLGARALSDTGVTRAQTASLFAAFTVPFVVMFLWLGQLVPVPANGAFLFGSVLSGLFVGRAVDRYNLFDLVPLAREMVFDELNDAVVVVDRDHRLLDYNYVAIDTFPGLEGEIGTNVTELVPALAGDDDGDSEGPFPSSFTSYRDGEPRIYDVTVSHLPSEENCHGYGLIIHDVTERRRRIRDLEQQTTQLERFASTLSHDLRNPLNVAQGNIQLAMDTGATERLERADDAIERIEQIIDDLLTLSREGRTIDDRQFVGLTDVAEAAWKTTATADATLEVELDPDTGVFADETRLQNVFENLFRNALSFGGAGVTIRVGSEDDGFYVEDDGPGIAPTEREKVFEYEYTTDSDGTGLGLAIVESITSAHGWSVHVTDGHDGGARFVFSDVDLVDGPSSATGQTDGVGPVAPTNTEP
ncbi:sensor histidine kinase [Halomicrobium zhouii]|uniref:sensor histidine kinase n=1 Tax=Halomicrobium zhouii TaxID=767519 RepID=UPI0015A65F9C|nr:histidine kinase N-terminal 7TM domain-containing protein [Halomicrobium zhouii]